LLIEFLTKATKAAHPVDDVEFLVNVMNDGRDNAVI